MFLWAFFCCSHSSQHRLFCWVAFKGLQNPLNILWDFERHTKQSPRGPEESIEYYMIKRIFYDRQTHFLRRTLFVGISIIWKGPLRAKKAVTGAVWPLFPQNRINEDMTIKIELCLCFNWRDFLWPPLIRCITISWQINLAIIIFTKYFMHLTDGKINKTVVSETHETNERNDISRDMGNHFRRLNTGQRTRQIHAATYLAHLWSPSMWWT